MNDAQVRLRYLHEVIAKLFPPGERSETFTVVPGRFAPRLLVPVSAPRAAERAVRPHRLSWAVRLGLFAERIHTPAGADTIQTYLSAALGTEVVVAVSARPALRANRKPVLQALTRDGRLLGFVKIGDSDLARRLVRHEHTVLEELARTPLKVVVPPRVLHHGVWRDLEVLVLSPLPVRRTRRRTDEDLLVAAVREIADLGEHAWHGDLTPWNVAGDGGRLLVWDWERFATGVPLGFDLVHHFFASALRTMKPKTAARACLAQAVRILAPLGLDGHEARRTALHYLIALADRHACDGHEPFGPPQRWLNPVVDQAEALL
ncbi:hypothetical protein [Rhizohabitans arisaemae]|uniref:hypothetical protein n=1 Tax=Rhizohabitans arisaemae TaxID=2720610 RepID=UPI0024B27715|nr:hypothetical protein [Rhizohabitans arisaemae]